MRMNSCIFAGRSWRRRPSPRSSRATPSPNRTACLPRDDGRGSTAKSPIATPACDNLRFGLSRIDSGISARGNHKSHVTARRTERPCGEEAALLDIMLGQLRVAGQDAGHAAGVLDSPNRFIDRLDDLGVIGFAEIAERGRKIARPDKHPVDALDPRNPFEVFKSALRLHL